MNKQTKQRIEKVLGPLLMIAGLLLMIVWGQKHVLAVGFGIGVMAFGFLLFSSRDLPLRQRVHGSEWKIVAWGLIIFGMLIMILGVLQNPWSIIVGAVLMASGFGAQAMIITNEKQNGTVT